MSPGLALLAAVTAALLLLIGRAIVLARRGAPVEVRPLAPVAAVADAIDSAVAAGRPVFFVPGSRDLDNMQTVAALSLLEQVARLCAEKGARLHVPVNRSMVMQMARSTCRAAFEAAGRGHAWRDDQVDYISDDPLGFVARVDGLVERERPGACFYFGFFASESLLLAEGGRHVGAVQVAGTASPVQLPFFVSSCDETLMGEELFAAGAKLSGDAALLGSLRGQDLGKRLAVALIVAGVALASLAQAGWAPAAAAWRVVSGLLAEV
ncbi:MAG TPA: hypothetical protein P5571_03685 [Candidatus Krumholzibacteria bacterium]|nr:hypothetical protein [Candidatus Krumholzibacteria bacterium]HRX50442.1 hypothetical protein [Candidatus Krumholzibacteria bacterium]